MKFAIISDTHGNIDNVVEFLMEKDLDFFIHLGDYTEDARDISRILDLNFYTVKGNNDYFDYQAQDFKVLKLKNKRFLLTHGHNEKVYYGFEGLINKAKKYNCQYVFFGHTHVFVDKVIDGVRIINPGSSSLPRDLKKSILLCDFEEKLVINKENL
ncbi:MAG: metallophosphoesterase [Tissierellia bacterium]|nr:metallophosphoesterase [Tissierellia bacterium]